MKRDGQQMPADQQGGDGRRRGSDLSNYQLHHLARRRAPGDAERERYQPR
jgi:hypothetical protein